MSEITWDEFIVITKKWLAACPPDIFDTAGTQGPQFVKALREAVADLEASDKNKEYHKYETFSKNFNKAIKEGNSLSEAITKANQCQKQK